MSDLALFARKCQVADEEKFLRNCAKLHALLVEANKVHNLTRIVEQADFEVKHIIDSLTIALEFPEIAKKELRIADIGCGAGFPSLVLAMGFPQLKITAIDSIGKKVSFVKLAAQELGLENLAPVWGRSIELNRLAEYKSAFDVVTARAVATASKISSESSNFLVSDGRYILYKTPQQLDEERANLAADKKFHWEFTQPRTYPHGERLFFVGRRKS